MALDAAYTEFAVEYSLAIALCFVRFYARWKTTGGGLRKFRADDYFLMLAMCLWSVQLATRHLATNHGTNVGLPPAVRAKLTPAQIAGRELGSKGLLVGWTMYASTTWALKASMIYFYWRLVPGSWPRTLLVVNAALTPATYIAVILTVYLSCLPFEKHFQVVPAPPKACTSLAMRQVSVGVPNLVTDVILLIIPLPLLVAVRLPMRTKIVTGCLLCGGIFIIVTCILRLYYVYDSGGHNTAISNAWSVRETFVSFLVINIPHLKPLFAMFRSNPNSRNTPSGPEPSGGYHHSRSRPRRAGPTDSELVRGSPQGSTEEILKGVGGTGAGGAGVAIQLEVRKETSFVVTDEVGVAVARGPDSPGEHSGRAAVETRIEAGNRAWR